MPVFLGVSRAFSHPDRPPLDRPLRTAVPRTALRLTALPLTALRRTALPRTALTRTAQNFAFFFSLPLQISLFSFTLWGLLVDLWPGFEAVDHPNCAFGLPGVWRAARWGRVGWGTAGWGPAGWEAHKFALFFPSPGTFFFHSSLSWGSTRGILVVFLNSGALKCARLEFSGCRVKPRRPHARQPESPPGEGGPGAKRRAVLGRRGGRSWGEEEGGPGAERRAVLGRSGGRSWGGAEGRRRAVRCRVVRLRVLQVRSKPITNNNHNRHQHQYQQQLGQTTNHLPLFWAKHGLAQIGWPKKDWPQLDWPKSAITFSILLFPVRC